MTDKHRSPLKDFLLDIVPPNKHGHKTLTELARLMPMSRWALQKWLPSQSIPAERVPRLVEISAMCDRHPVPLRDFDRFVYGDPAASSRGLPT